MIELERRQILSKHQAGFRPQKSTLDNVVRLHRYAQDQFRKRRHAAVILLDIKAAFDSVWHDGLKEGAEKNIFFILKIENIRYKNL